MNHILIEENYTGVQGLTLVQLNRPKQLNALSTQTLKEIVHYFEDQLQNKNKTKVAIITGNDRAFSAGADLKQMVELSAIDQLKDERESLWTRFRQISFPIIAAVNGFCLGGGCELAMACDFILAGDNAQFGQPEINVGIMPGAGGTQRLTKILGKSKTMYHCLTGDYFTAQEAHDMGLIAKIFPSKTLLDESIIIAKKITQKSTLAASLIKESINSSMNTHLDEGLKLERKNFYLSFASQDQKEGMRAFLEKRKPQYKGE